MTDIAWGSSRNPVERDAMAKWAASKIWPNKPYKQFDKCTTMGIVRNGLPIACVVYHDWEPDAGVIEFSGVATSKRWLSRSIIHSMFNYPFADLGCQMLVTRNSADDYQSHLHRMLGEAGFQKQIVRRLFGANEDAALWTMTADEWRLSKYNKEPDHG